MIRTYECCPKIGYKYTNFRMVFTPTLFSSEKKTNIWLEGSVRELVKKFSWFRLRQGYIVSNVFLGLQKERRTRQCPRYSRIVP